MLEEKIKDLGENEMERERIIEILKHLEGKLTKKEIIAIQDDSDNYMCPTCKQVFTGEDIIKYGYRWCYSCGQRVDFTLPRNRIIRH